MKENMNLTSVLIPPEPTNQLPYIQIEWIWQCYMRRFNAESDYARFRTALSAYIRSLNIVKASTQLMEDPRFYLCVHWDHLAICKAERFWHHTGLNNVTIRGYVQCLRDVVEYAADNNLTATKTFIYPNFDSNFVPIGFEPYDDDELKIIRQVIQESVLYASNIVSGY